MTISPGAFKDALIESELLGTCPPSRYQTVTNQRGTEAGVKHDHGKVRMDLVLSGFPRALLAVGEIATFGCLKYTENGWVSVPDGVKRYTSAMTRHLLAEQRGEMLDLDSGLMHAAHAAWGALARLELVLREKEK